MDATNWVSSLASIVLAVSVILVWWQARLLSQQIEQTRIIMEKDHERSRRENTTRAIQQWVTDIRPESSAADKVVWSLDDDRCRRLVNLQKTKIHSEQKELLECCIGRGCCNVEGEDGLIELRGDEVALLRYHTMAYLNSTETLLTSWQLNIVDQNTIVNQFKFLYRPKEGYDTLEKFRIAAGGTDSFPSTEAFIKKLKELYNSSIPVPKQPLA